MVFAPARANGIWVPGQDTEDAAPTMDEVLSLKQDYLGYYRAFHQQCLQEEEYYYGRNPIPVPEGFSPVRPATAHAIINIATDHVDVSNISIDVPAGPRAKARGERLKKFYQGCWDSIKEPVLRAGVRHANIYGIGWLKVMYASDRYPDAPVFPQDTDNNAEMARYSEELEDFLEKKRIIFPFVVRNINPYNLIWDDSWAGRQWTIEFYDKQARDIKRRYPEWVSSKPNESMASWGEYWDNTWCGYFADNQWVWGPYRHGYGFNPYVPIVPANSLSFDNGPPHLRYRGILRPVHSLLDSEGRLSSQYESILTQYAWRTMDFYGQRQAADETAEAYEMFGAKNVILPGVEVRASPTAVPPPELLQQINQVQTMIEEATFPNVVRGVRPRGVSSGFAISVLSGQGRLVFQGIADGLARTIEQVNSRFAMLVENKVRGRVTVRARSAIHNFDQTIGPDDIRGMYENIVQLKAEAPEERERQSILAQNLHQAGIISLYEAQRRAGITNPLEEQMQQAAERLLQSPEIQAEQTRLAAERMGLLGQLAEAVSGDGQPAQGEGFNLGQFQPGMPQLQRPGEAGIQRQRVTSNMQNASVFPRGMGGLDILGSQLGTAPGGAMGLPSGGTVR
jgi:hypothetical protein